MVIDLSIRLSNDTPVFPGDPAIALEPVGSFATDGYALTALRLGTHSGTHIDAPAHMIDGGPTLGSLQLDRFVGRGTLIQGLTLEAARAANLQPGDIAVFHTNMSKRLGEPAYFTDYPAMDIAVADLLVERQVAMVAIDTCSIDNTQSFDVHLRLLSAGIPIAENLTNLDNLVGRRFRIIALPLAIDADGAPARVVAEVLDLE